MFGKTMKKFFNKMSPKRRIAALVDAVVDRLNDKYKVVVKVVDGGFEVTVVDRHPEDRIELPDHDEED